MNALQTHGFAGTHREEEPVTLPDQLVGTRLIEDHATVGDAGGREGQPARHVGLDRSGHHIDGRPLGCQDEMDTRSAGQLVIRTIASSTSLGATIIRSASSSTNDQQVR